MGVIGTVCMCAGVRKSVPHLPTLAVNVGLRQGDKERALSPFRHKQGCAHITGHITTQR